MIGRLGGNQQTVAAYHASMGKKIAKIEMREDVSHEGDWNSADDLTLTFDDGSQLHVWDGGRSCCEHRYITTDDVLDSFVGQVLQSIDLRDGPDHPESEYGDCHEEQFVLLTMTDGSNITIVTHNEHNGYYGGFHIQLAVTPTPN